MTTRETVANSADQLRIERLRSFFLRSAAITYAAGGAAKSTIPHLPHSKVYRVTNDDSSLFYIDTYFTNGEYSGGQTVIWEDGIPVWLMQYQGWCKNDDPVVLAFLKRALLTNYERGIFFGGRGEASYSEHTRNRELWYVNSVEGNFDDFRGCEGIFDHLDQAKGFLTLGATPGFYQSALFWHRYQGMLLMPAPARLF